MAAAGAPSSLEEDFPWLAVGGIENTQLGSKSCCQTTVQISGPSPGGPFDKSLQNLIADKSQSSEDLYGQTLLPPEDVAAFERDGFVYLRGAVDMETVAAVRSVAWKEVVEKLGATCSDVSSPSSPSSPQDVKFPHLPCQYPVTWPDLSQVPTPRHSKQSVSVWDKWISPRVVGALDSLVGKQCWHIPNNEGDTPEHWFFPIKFPIPHEKEKEWRPCNVKGQVDKGWHLDLGADFGARTFEQAVATEHAPHPAMVLLFLMSDIEPGGGGTLLLPGSQRMSAEYVEDETNKWGTVVHKDMVDWCNSSLNKLMNRGDVVLPACGRADGGVLAVPSIPHTAQRRGLANGKVAANGGAAKTGNRDEEKTIEKGRAGSMEATVGEVGRELEGKLGRKRKEGCVELHQMCGKAGDVILMHPWTIHTCAQNFSDRVRVMGNTAVRYRQGAYEKWRRARSSSGSAVPLPTQPPVARAAMGSPPKGLSAVLLEPAILDVSRLAARPAAD